MCVCVIKIIKHHEEIRKRKTNRTHVSFAPKLKTNMPSVLLVVTHTTTTTITTKGKANA